MLEPVGPALAVLLVLGALLLMKFSFVCVVNKSRFLYSYAGYLVSRTS